MVFDVNLLEDFKATPLESLIFRLLEGSPISLRELAELAQSLPMPDEKINHEEFFPCHRGTWFIGLQPQGEWFSKASPPNLLFCDISSFLTWMVRLSWSLAARNELESISGLVVADRSLSWSALERKFRRRIGRFWEIQKSSLLNLDSTALVLGYNDFLGGVSGYRRWLRECCEDAPEGTSADGIEDGRSMAWMTFEGELLRNSQSVVRGLEFKEHQVGLWRDYGPHGVGGFVWRGSNEFLEGELSKMDLNLPEEIRALSYFRLCPFDHWVPSNRHYLSRLLSQYEKYCFHDEMMTPEVVSWQGMTDALPHLISPGLFVNKIKEKVESQKESQLDRKASESSPKESSREAPPKDEALGVLKEKLEKVFGKNKPTLSDVPKPMVPPRFRIKV